MIQYKQSQFINNEGMSIQHRNNFKPKQDQLKGINYLIPNAICKLLASGAILINLYWSQNHEVQLIGMGVATLFSFAFGYLIIICLNLCLAYEIGRKRDSPQQIGIYYQRALVINFIICAFLITPLLYISNKIVVLFIHIDSTLAQVVGEYLFQLVPSIYCFAFYDTTQTFLLAQGSFLAPLVINIFGFFCHFYFIGFLGAAWSKNLTDFGRYCAIYLHLILRKKKMSGWNEWTIQCFKGWENRIRYFKNIGMTTYSQSFFFFFFSIIGYAIPRSQLICHICFINIAQMIFIVNIGLKEGLIVKLAYYIRKRKIKYTQNLGIKSAKIFFAVSIIFVFLMLMYVDQICNFFFTASAAKEIFKEKYWILFCSIIVDSLNFSLSTMMKVFNNDYSLLKIQFFFLFFSSIMAYIFCYKLSMGLSGLWYGSILGSSLNSAFSWIMLLKYQMPKQSGKAKKQTLLMRKQYDQDDF